MTNATAFWEMLTPIALAGGETLNILGVSLIYVAAHSTLRRLNSLFHLPKIVTLIEQGLLGLSLALIVALSIHHAWVAFLDQLAK
jgi:hypothetical protein